MTPMVDLAFLLLTFFVLTSTFSKPRIMRLAYPAKNEDKESEAPKVKNGITFLLSKDKIFSIRESSLAHQSQGLMDQQP